MYQNIISEKDSYVTKEKDITWDVFSGADDSYSKAIITYYYKSGQLKHATLNASSVGQYEHYKRNIELYYNNKTLFFIYSVRDNIQWKEVYEQKGKQVSTIEERIYFDKNGKCIRYLIKEAKGKPETIDSLRQALPNVKLDCLDAEELIKEIEKYF
jgi:hypothetical protein